MRKDKRKKKEKEFEKRGDANLLSAYDVQNDHPSELKKGGATAKNSTGTPTGDSANVNATVNAPIAKPSKLGLGTITAVESSSTSATLHSAEEGQHAAEMKPGNAEAEKPEQEPTFTHNVVCPTVQPSLNGPYSTIAPVPPLQNNTMPYMRAPFYPQHFPG